MLILRNTRAGDCGLSRSADFGVERKGMGNESGGEGRGWKRRRRVEQAEKGVGNGGGGREGGKRVEGEIGGGEGGGGGKGSGGGGAKGVREGIERKWRGGRSMAGKWGD